MSGSRNVGVTLGEQGGYENAKNGCRALEAFLRRAKIISFIPADITAYCFFGKKPSISMESEFSANWFQYACLHFIVNISQLLIVCQKLACQST